MLLKHLDRAIKALAVCCLAASAAMIIANVFYRYVVLDWLGAAARQFNWLRPIYETLNEVFGTISVTADEVPGYLLVWIAFLGAYLALRKEGHISFDALIDALPAPLQRGLRSWSDAVILAFLAMLLWQSLRMIWIDGATEIETAEIAQGWFMAVLPIAAVLLAIPLALRMARRLRGHKDMASSPTKTPPSLTGAQRRASAPHKGGGNVNGGNSSSSPLEGEDRGGG